ncbi:ferredoxin [Micromonospora polyrhachis]|uniref:Ferredoxin n=1 Tax=Micromonospora polyrhachis TaxID=1282883 RepID=A0A7W7SLA9_9ACTN|nr:ferredoxin [Micromonospora polyrhachis]MBB4956829.1 ferredoxin [Micromonospora polyrhachis]
MFVEANPERCCGAGMCALAAPEVFGQDEEAGTVLVLASPPDVEHWEAVQDAVQLCPSGAIRIVMSRVDEQPI